LFMKNFGIQLLKCFVVLNDIDRHKDVYLIRPFKGRFILGIFETN
jgi:hypothetical protein